MKDEVYIFGFGLLVGLVVALFIYIRHKTVEEHILEARDLERKAQTTVKAELYAFADDIGRGAHKLEAIPGKLKIAIGKIL